MLKSQTDLDNAFRALADPTRRAIVSRLSQGQATVSDLARPLLMSMAAVVQHIQLLEQCGVIQTHKTGRIRTCRMEPQALSLVEGWLWERRAAWQRHFDGLAAVLEEQETTPNSTGNL